MEKIFISGLTIESVRHLKDIRIPLSRDKRKHLIFTGKNGSGKTSVLDALSRELSVKTAMDERERTIVFVEPYSFLGKGQKSGRNPDLVLELKSGISLEFNEELPVVKECFHKGEWIQAYYKADRNFQAEVPKHVEKIELKDNYAITESPRQLFIKYLLDLKVTEALAKNSRKAEKAQQIERWFVKFQELLQKIFDDPSLELIFEEDTFSFSIREKDKELFDFNTLASGFAAILDIVLDLIMRMEKTTQRSFDFTVPGIVLIDEVETHLHLQLQKTILGLLTTLFPNVQFIMSTHSPFILNSLSDVVIYDLEKNLAVTEGLSDIPYGGIVEGYFNADLLSSSLRTKFERYKSLVQKKDLSDDDFEEIARLEMFLDEIPDYLALGLTTEYQRLKLKLENREDIGW